MSLHSPPLGKHFDRLRSRLRAKHDLSKLGASHLIGDDALDKRSRGPVVFQRTGQLDAGHARHWLTLLVRERALLNEYLRGLELCIRDHCVVNGRSRGR